MYIASYTPWVPPILTPFINKTVPFRFQGRDLRLHLSHALFSSFDIDDGTRLLLKTIAQRIDLRAVHAALDIGCGIGVIGACIRAQADGAAVLMQDRDSLAAAFAAENCRLNGLGGVTVEPQLAFWRLEGRQFDLVTSNLPAKAGQPVIASFLRHAAGCLAPAGVAAVVIVAPLADFARRALDALGCRTVFSEETKGYTVLHFTAGSLAMESDGQREDIGPYIREKAVFEGNGTAYELETVHALPDFDTIGHGLALSFDLLADATVAGDLLFWNSGQGHLPVFLETRFGRAISSVSLASRDCLELAITARNLAAGGWSTREARAVPFEDGLIGAHPPSSFDLICMNPHPIPRVPWQEGCIEAAHALLRPGGALCVSSTSTEMHRLLDRRKGFRLVASGRHAGCRAAILRRS
jgi:SAM-dependent methyltransferase